MNGDSKPAVDGKCASGKKTGLLLSGGMDSITLAWWKRPAWAITIDYGQRAARAEAEASAQVCAELGIEHELVTVDCRALGSGDLSNSAPHALAPESDWWPYRNQLLITLACMRAIAREVGTLMIGTVASDGDSHRDGTAEFVARVNGLVSYQEGGLNVFAPAIGWNTAEAVQATAVPARLLAWAHSCHKADVACGDCRGCYKHMAVYGSLGARYRADA